MPDGPFGFPRFTDFGPFVDAPPTVDSVNAYRDLVREQLQDHDFGGFPPSCEPSPEQREVCDRLSFLLTDALEGLVRGMAPEVVEEQTLIGGVPAVTLQLRGITAQEAINIQEAFQDARQSALDAAREAGLKEVGRGTARIVFTDRLNENCVMKLAQFRWLKSRAIQARGVRENLHATRVWKEAPPRVKEFLTPIKGFDPDGRWVNMPNLPTHVGEDTANRFEEDLARVLPEDWGLWDVKGANVGKLNGSFRLVDFGAIILPDRLRVE